MSRSGKKRIFHCVCNCFVTHYMLLKDSVHAFFFYKAAGRLQVHLGNYPCNHSIDEKSKM